MNKIFSGSFIHYLILPSAFCLLLSASCGRKDDLDRTGDDTTPPQVIYAYPADSAAGLPRNTVVYVVFSETMKQSTAQSAFSASGASGTFLWFGNSMVFVPSAQFTADDTVRVTVSSAAEDLAGNGLAPAFSRWFTVGASSDNVRPAVSALSPAAGSSGVAPGATITMLASEPVLQFISGSVRLTDSLNNAVAGNTSWQDSVTVAFNPTSDLAANMRYTVTVDTILRDRCWNRNETASWQFTTEADLTPPTIASISPANGSGTASLKDSIVVAFSEPMDTASARAAFAMNPAVAGSFSWSGMAVMKFKPSQILAVKRTYQVTINSTARDRNGVLMAAPFNATFTTDRVIYAASVSANRIFVLARTTGEEMQRIDDAYALRLACSPDGTKLYVLTAGAAGSLRVLDPQNAHQQERSISLGNQPYALGLSASGNRLAVSNYGSGTVTVIDTMGWSATSFSVETGPRGVAFGSGNIFAACADAARLSSYTTSGTFVQNVVIHGTSKMLCLSASRDTIYLCEGDQVSAFLSSDLAWLGSATTDCEDAIRAGNYLYVSDPLNPRVRVYSPSPSLGIIGHVQDITVGSAARGLCASADGTRVFSANGAAGTVSEISTATNTVVNTITVGAAVDAVAVSP
jgi:YVTN family beta-propeller protein